MKAESTYVIVHPTGYTVISGESKGGREVELHLRSEHADILRRTFEAEKITGADHIGHAYWHARNPDAPLPCPTCKA